MTWLLVYGYGLLDWNDFMTLYWMLKLEFSFRQEFELHFNVITSTLRFSYLQVIVKTQIYN